MGYVLFKKIKNGCSNSGKKLKMKTFALQYFSKFNMSVVKLEIRVFDLTIIEL